MLIRRGGSSGGRLIQKKIRSGVSPKDDQRGRKGYSQRGGLLLRTVRILHNEERNKWGGTPNFEL